MRNLLNCHCYSLFTILGNSCCTNAVSLVHFTFPFCIFCKHPNAGSRQDLLFLRCSLITVVGSPLRNPSPIWFSFDCEFESSAVDSCLSSYSYEKDVERHPTQMEDLNFTGHFLTTVDRVYSTSSRKFLLHCGYPNNVSSRKLYEHVHFDFVFYK